MTDLVEWVIERHKEIEEKTKISTTGGDLSFVELNIRMSQFGGDYAWVIAENAIAEQRYRRKQHEFDRWYNEIFVTVRQELEKGVAAKTVEAVIATRYKDDWKKWEEELLELELEKNVREKFLSLWGSMKDIYVELARNLRSDIAGSKSISVGRSSGSDMMERIKRARQESAKGEGNESR